MINLIPIIGTIETVSESFGLVLRLANQLVKQLPSYDKRKKDEFVELVLEYKTQLTRDYRYRDDNRIDILRDRLKALSLEFADHAEKQGDNNA